MDCLSELLRGLRLRGSVYYRKEFPSPWGFRSPAGPFAPFHLNVRGSCWFQSGEGPPRRLDPGDMVIFPTGAAHWLADRNQPPSSDSSDPDSDRAATSDEATTLVCGHFEFDRGPDHPLRAALPPVMRLAAGGRRGSAWLEPVLWSLVETAGDDSAGAAALADRLAEAVFIEAVRRAVEQGESSTGLAAALRDPRLSSALAVMHAEPGRPWSLEELARRSGMSRASFAQKFRATVGTPPMSYLNAQRLRTASERLVESDDSVAEIARRSGFGSDAAFVRAFKRYAGSSPGAWRRSRASG